jgi:hypothetical protein
VVATFLVGFHMFHHLTDDEPYTALFIRTKIRSIVSASHFSVNCLIVEEIIAYMPTGSISSSFLARRIAFGHTRLIEYLNYVAPESHHAIHFS